MSNILSKVELPEDSTVLQYVDDVLIASKPEAGHQRALQLVLRELADAGLKVSPKKAQIAKGTDGVWRREGKVIAPACIQTTLMELHHGLSHVGRDTMLGSLGREWWWKGIGRDVAQYCHKCTTCAQHNPGRPIKVRMGHQPRPKGPWENIQMDFTGPLPPSYGKTYCLVIIDQFTL